MITDARGTRDHHTLYSVAEWGKKPIYIVKGFFLANAVKKNNQIRTRITTTRAVKRHRHEPREKHQIHTCTPDPLITSHYRLRAKLPSGGCLSLSHVDHKNLLHTYISKHRYTSKVTWKPCLFVFP